MEWYNIIGIISGYAFMSGVSFALIYKLSKIYNWDEEECVPFFVFGTIFWPLIFPFLMGYLFFYLILKL